MKKWLIITSYCLQTLFSGIYHNYGKKTWMDGMVILKLSSCCGLWSVEGQIKKTREPYLFKETGFPCIYVNTHHIRGKMLVTYKSS